MITDVRLRLAYMKICKIKDCVDKLHEMLFLELNKKQDIKLKKAKSLRKIIFFTLRGFEKDLSILCEEEA